MLINIAGRITLGLDYLSLNYSEFFASYKILLKGWCSCLGESKCKQSDGDTSTALCSSCCSATHRGQMERLNVQVCIHTLHDNAMLLLLIVGSRLHQTGDKSQLHGCITSAKFLVASGYCVKVRSVHALPDCTVGDVDQFSVSPRMACPILPVLKIAFKIEQWLCKKEDLQSYSNHLLPGKIFFSPCSYVQRQSSLCKYSSTYS